MTLAPRPHAQFCAARVPAPARFFPSIAGVTPPPAYRPASSQSGPPMGIQRSRPLSGQAPMGTQGGAPPVYRPAAHPPIQARMAPPSPTMPQRTAPFASLVIQREIDTASIDTKAAGIALTGHFGQRVRDQAALSKWNINAEGRNQGLVHLIDYAYARPSSLSVTPEANVKSQAKLSDMQYHMLSTLDDPSRAGVSHEILTSPTRGYKFSEEQIKLLVAKGYLEVIETPALKAAKDDVVRLEREIEQLATAKRGTIITSGVTGRAISEQLAIYKAGLPEVLQLAVAKTKANSLTTYMTKSDVSKRGRLGLIATAGGLGSIARGKEIEKGTEIVTGLMTSSAPTQISSAAPTRNMTLWQQTGGLSKNPYPQATPGLGRQAWHEVDTPPLGLKSTASGEFKGSGLTVKVWGVLEDPSVALAGHAKNLGISTVMGGS